MNKIRVIDLLNKIANGEEVPKKIKYLTTIYEYKDCDYYDSKGEYLSNKICLDKSDLNDEIEIIEKNKLNRLDNRVAFLKLSNEDKLSYLYEITTKIIDKVNELENKDV